MARIQILELPTVYREQGEDETPFVVIIDQATESTAAALGLAPHTGNFSPLEGMQRALSVSVAEQIGARTVLVFEETVDIPANDLTLNDIQDSADRAGVVRLRVEPDLTGFHEAVMAAVAKARADAANGGE